MKIVKAETAGFCFGVDQAVNMAFAALRKAGEEHGGRKVFSFGELIHNKAVIDRLEAEGLRVADNIDDLEPRARRRSRSVRTDRRHGRGDH